MPMDKDRHEEILNQLLDGSLEQSTRTELLQELRADYGSVLSEHEENTTKITDLQAKHDDLVVSNSMLFRQIGVSTDENKEEETKKEFSETVTLEQLENNAN